MGIQETRRNVDAWDHIYAIDPSLRDTAFKMVKAYVLVRGLEIDKGVAPVNDPRHLVAAKTLRELNGKGVN